MISVGVPPKHGISGIISHPITQGHDRGISPLPIDRCSEYSGLRPEVSKLLSPVRGQTWHRPSDIQYIPMVVGVVAAGLTHIHTMMLTSHSRSVSFRSTVQITQQGP